MVKKIKEIDVYISKSAAFAQPILNRLRDTVHKACPGVEETIKWSCPHFQYNGTILCSMVAFKQHCAFGFWLTPYMEDPEGILSPENKMAPGHLDHIESLASLPPVKVLSQYIREAMKLIDQGVKLSKKIKAPSAKTLNIPDWFINTLKKHKKAFDTFNGFSYSNQKEYLDWLTEAKTEATRQKRLAEAITWMAEGKVRNWKYLKHP